MTVQNVAGTVLSSRPTVVDAPFAAPLTTRAETTSQDIAMQSAPAGDVVKFDVRPIVGKHDAEANLEVNNHRKTDIERITRSLVVQETDWKTGETSMILPTEAILKMRILLRLQAQLTDGLQLKGT